MWYAGPGSGCCAWTKLLSSGLHTDLHRLAGPEADAFLGEPITRALLLADSDQVSRVELMSGLINAVAGRLGRWPGDRRR